MSLDKYRSKRQLDKTPEPAGGVSDNGSGHSFVIQEHHARHLHFDLRLEINGVLKSWAVPKGPSLDPHEKRLAVQTEDHPLEYLTFEGIIPQGNYGAGEVAVWDIGSYEIIDPANPEQGLHNGKLSFRLKGRRLCGEFHLVRTRQAQDSWLLMKKADECAIPGWTLEPVLAPDSKSRPLAEAATVVVNGAEKHIIEVKIGKPGPFPAQVEPMLATLVNQPFDDADWLFEVKWDGYRSICYVEDDRIRFVSRNHIDLSDKFPELLAARSEISARTAVMDGEIVALNAEGKPDFQLMQDTVGFRAKPSSADKPVLVYYVFDLLYCNGHDLSNEPLLDRKHLLSQLIDNQGRIRLSDHVQEKGTLLFEQIREQQMEGIVAKDSHSKYEQRRSKKWLKIKTVQTMDAVIGGYTKGRGSRSSFGALILGLYDQDQLRYIGNVGGGFSENSLKQIFELMSSRRTDNCPFATAVKTDQQAQWLRPELVCEVRYMEITSDGKLRHPIFMRIRDDKDPRTCTLEAQAIVEVEKTPAGHPKLKGAAMGKKTAPLAADFLAAETLHGNRQVLVDGHELALTNLDKIYWPDSGFTKGDFIRYYYQIAATILPHLQDRPLVLKRYPNGIKAPAFYQHNLEGAPPFIKTWTSPANDKGEQIVYALCNNRATLVYLANLGALQISPWHSRYLTTQHPDYVVLDLDPGPDTKYPKICTVALIIRDLLDKAGLQSCPKTSGSRGLHIFIPVEAIYAHEQATAFAEVVARLTHDFSPKDTTIERMTRKRPAGTVYIDYLQNGLSKTLAGVYTVRAREGATVSAPLTWPEVEQCLQPAQFTIKTMGDRIDKVGDLFLPVLELKQRLKQALAILQGN